jgi:glycosyltransferase involved in cell wall biosynthesis
MRISLICTVINEERSIDALIESIFNQNHKPDEVVIVDGGSKDRTIDILKQYAKKYNIKIISAPGANISQGRNIAIKHAKHPIIVSTDGGTRHDKSWLKHLVSPILEGKADVSAGLFFPDPKTPFEEVAGNLLYPDMNKIPDNWPPSARSMAFKKLVWKKVGGFPEYLYTAEDSVFNYRARDEFGFKYQVARKSKAYWRPRPTLWKLIKQYYTYAKGNGEALLSINHYPENRMFYLNYLILFGLLAISFIRIMYALYVLVGVAVLFFIYGLIRFKNLRGAIYTMLILYTLPIANFFGNHVGIFR